MTSVFVYTNLSVVALDDLDQPSDQLLHASFLNPYRYRPISRGNPFLQTRRDDFSAIADDCIAGKDLGGLPGPPVLPATIYQTTASSSIPSITASARIMRHIALRRARAKTSAGRGGGGNRRDKGLLHAPD
ncbi:hypothetical protein AAL_01041 [Moelleriella libera RCEF 2490]|uniref:Uncharacterized protein n=1 Tax=Moelleriella libera RCEF 2490 TaxID=1081109 RepID=A0A166VEL3_9HYPO|nr:hypothetical protein AAL_01041 [Moelleriella libera RCEF 2490]